MRQRTVSSTLCFARGRLDSEYFLAPGVAARDSIDAAAGAGRVHVEQGANLGRIWQPSRFKRMYAADGEEAVPYLRPYDVFEYLPKAAEHLSAQRTERVGDYRLAAGTILQTCSGRNLGPLTMADAYLSRFALSHDMLRIEIDDKQLRFYTYAFLTTSIGQAILRQGMSGSVVDHLTAADIESLGVPVLADVAMSEVSELAEQSYRLVETGRLELDAIIQEMANTYPSQPREAPKRQGWSAKSRDLLGGQRLDAHFHDPHIAQARDQMREAGGGLLGDVATAFLPARYKRYYVGPSYGRPILSGRQLLQAEPVNLRHISDRSFKDPTLMELKAGMIAFGAVGRWEGRLGEPALITSSRAGWLASNDVMRLTPGASVDPGWLWLALVCEPVQRQIAALPYGSVIDHTGPEDIQGLVWLPPIDATLGARARNAWQRFDDARRLRQEAASRVEAALGTAETDAIANAS